MSFQKYALSLKTGAKNNELLRLFEYTKVVRNDKLDEQTNFGSGETEKSVRKLSENYGEHSESSIGVVGRPAE